MQSKLPNTGTTIFSVMSSLAKEHNAINLSQGFPNFKIDPQLKEFVKQALDDEQVQYAPMPGRLDLREQLAAKMFVQHGKMFDPNSEITITAGATQAIYTSIAAVIHKGDEVILFDPAYDCYDPSVRIHGGTPKRINLKFPDYRIDWDEVEAAITDKTRMLITNNPHNPTGTAWNGVDLERLEKICEEHPKIVVLSDEVYEHIQFKGDHHSVLKSELLRSRSIVTYSFGKTFHVTGWKIGYFVAPAELTREIRKIHQYNVFCVNNTMQAALAKYLNAGQKWKEVKELYKPKCELFQEGMKSSKFKALPCEGTYFCLYDYSAMSDLSDVEFAKWLTKEHQVASIPVSVFYGDKTDNHVVRFCFAKTADVLSQAINKLCAI